MTHAVMPALIDVSSYPAETEVRRPGAQGGDRI
jgi:hypothetical protein